MGHFDRNLPVLENPEPEENLPSCSPKIYVSNEEAAVLAAMRNLRERSMDLRRELKKSTPGARTPLEAELEELRSQWQDLARRRDRAFTRKMIALGHLPPNYPTE